MSLKGWNWARYFPDISSSANTRDKFIPDPVKDNMLVFKKDYYIGSSLRTNKAYLHNLSEADLTSRYKDIFPDQTSRIRQSALNGTTVSYIILDQEKISGSEHPKYVNHSGAINSRAFYTQIDSENVESRTHTVFCFCL